MNCSLIASLFLLTLTCICVGQVQQKVGTGSEPTDMNKMSVDEAASFGTGIVDAYHRNVRLLLEQAGHKDLSAEKRVWPIYVLGELRAPDAVTVLLQNIEFEAKQVEEKDRIRRWGRYPAVEALSKIGHPSSRMILDVFLQEKGADRRKLMYQVLYNVEGKDVSIYLLRQRMNGARDDSERSTLNEAISYLQAIEL